jgi:hypothetical protein
MAKKYDDGYGEARDGFRGYARDSWNTSAVGKPVIPTKGGKRQDRIMGYGDSNLPREKAFMQATNRRMQSTLQKKAQARKDALIAKSKAKS